MAQVFCVFVLVLAFVGFGSASAHICDVCDCQPTQNEVFSITCGCERIKHLQLSSNLMFGVESTAMVVIKNCETVSVESNSLSQLTKLDTLGVQNCKRVYLATGAFSNLNSLLINNVEDVSFGEMALMGARGIRNIFIHSSNITQLPKFALYDIDGMDRFTMTNVNVGRVHTKAINITARSVNFENAKIYHVDPEGLTIQAQKVLVKKSEINTDRPNTITIKTEFQTRFLENDFKNMFNAKIVSPFAEFFGNRFYDIDTQTFNEIQMPRLTNNFIYNTKLYEMLQKFDHKDFHDNEFPCNCNMNLTSMTRRTLGQEILKNNFCIANCSLSLFDFEVESVTECFRSRKIGDLNRYCTEERIRKGIPGVVGLESTSAGPFGQSENRTDVHLQSRFLGVNENGNSGAPGQFGYATFVFYAVALILRFC